MNKPSWQLVKVSNNLSCHCPEASPAAEKFCTPCTFGPGRELRRIFCLPRGKSIYSDASRMTLFWFSAWISTFEIHEWSCRSNSIGYAHNSTGWERFGMKRISVTAVKYGISYVSHQSENQNQWNEKLAVESARTDRQKSHTVLPKVCSRWICLKSKGFQFPNKQHSVINDSQREPFWFPSRTGETSLTKAKSRDQPHPMTSVARTTSPLSNWMFSGERTNIRNTNRMKIVGKWMMSRILTEIISKRASETIHRFYI
jgi:hypothetical protein